MKWVNAEQWWRGLENFLCTLFVWAGKHAKSSALPRLLQGCCTYLAALFIKSIPIAPFCALAVCCSAYACTVFTSSSSLQLQSSVMLSSSSLSGVLRSTFPSCLWQCVVQLDVIQWKSISEVLWNYRKQSSNCAFRQRPKSLTDLHLILWDGWIAQDCQFLKCHEAYRTGLRPPPTVHLLLHLLPVQWRNQGGFWVGSLWSSCLRPQTTKLCIGKAHHHGLYSNQTTACMDNDMSGQLFRISCPNFGNMLVLVSSHTCTKEHFPQSASTRETQRTWRSCILTTTYWLSFSFIWIDAVKEQTIKQGSSLVTKKN